MKVPKLTVPRGPAKLIKFNGGGRAVDRMSVKAGIMMASAMALSGCINVSAPEEPIVIQLDINIRAEVLYRLAEDAGNTVDENADIF